MLELVDARGMRESDAETIRRGISGRELMLRAARGVFESYSWQGPVSVVCGAGNNAGDGYALALLLSDAGVACRVICLHEKCSEDGRYYLDRCREKEIDIVSFDASVDFSMDREVVDCIFGTGFSGEVRGVAREAILKINASHATVISVDINSGLDATNGRASPAVRSDLTVSIGTRKYGHYLNDAKDYIGALKNVDIGISIISDTARLVEASDLRSVLGTRRQNVHKGDFGYVAILGGCREYAGAVQLAAMSCAALRAGCGVATLAIPTSLAPAVTPHLLESTLFCMPDESGAMQYSTEAIDRLCERNSVLAIGMGWGRSDANVEILRYILREKELRLIIDADGLFALSRLPSEVLRESRCRVVLTPHMGEFSRLCGASVEDIASDPVKHAKEYARKTGTVLLLKGACTVVTDGAEVYFSDRGCAGMATAGSGDVLSGVLCGLLGSREGTPLTVATGAYLAGRAGELAAKERTEIGMLASDTVAMLPEVLREIMEN